MRLRARLRVEAQAAFDRLVSGQEWRVSFISQWIRKDDRKTLRERVTVGGIGHQAPARLRAE
jgi:hypothetical protein